MHVLIEFNGVAILIDPFISVQPSRGGMARYTPSRIYRRISILC